MVSQAVIRRVRSEEDAFQAETVLEVVESKLICVMVAEVGSAAHGFVASLASRLELASVKSAEMERW